MTPFEKGERESSLRRVLTLPLATLYGLGTIVGAGIYVLVGEVVAYAGGYAPVAFVVAGLIAALTAFSYAELCARYPSSAGEAVYVHQGFHSRVFSTAVGLGVAFIGLVSAATIAHGFVGYLQVFLAVPHGAAMVALIVFLGGVAAWGIRESVWLAATVTVLEIGGLLLVVGVVVVFGDGPEADPVHLLPPLRFEFWPGILAGSVLAFYAFIGFEDMVNVAEEVKEPTRNLPRAILLALIVSLLLYLTVVIVVAGSVPRELLAGSRAPMALVWERVTGRSPLLITGLSLLAVVNGAMIQMIMASRVLYGMGRRGWLPEWLGTVNRRTRTPLRSTLVVTATVTAFALLLPLVTLAQLTSVLTLAVFASIHLALWRIQGREPAPEGVTPYPRWLPLAGVSSCLALLVAQLLEWL
ncbi:MAG: amino acid permease [Gammaproteobacteria bacterium]